MREALIVGSLLVPVSVAEAKLFVSFLTRQG